MNDQSLNTPNRQEEQLEDGWTSVGRGKGRRPVYPQGDTNRPMRDTTMEKIRADFDAKVKIWRRSDCRKQLVQILHRQRPEAGWQIGDAVCLATGSFSRENWQSRQRSVMQFVAFTDVVQHLQSGQSEKILSYAQEPNYTPMDKTFLTSIGVATLDNADDFGLGAATKHFSPTTFVFEPFMDLGVASMKELLDVDVRLYIGSSLQRCIRDSEKKDAEIARELKKHNTYKDGEVKLEDIRLVRAQSQQATGFVQSRRSYRFPKFEEDPHVFEGMTIYSKEPEDEDDG